jgi:phospholipase C
MPDAMPDEERPMPRRRDVLRWATALAATSPWLDEAIRRAAMIPAATPTGTIKDVEHVVILMQENRSFDHYFGTYQGVRGFGDPRPIPLYPANGPGPAQTVFRQGHPADPAGVLPYPLHPQPSPVVACFSGLPHDYKSGYEAVNGGRNDKWAIAKSPQTMAYYQGADIPFHFALAETFTICDAYHCSVNGPTHPNRLFLWSGTNGQGDRVHGPRIDNNDKPYQFGWTTYPERLEKAGISWQLYQNARINNGKDQFGATNAGLNALQWFKPYDHQADPASALVSRGNAVKTLDDLRSAVQKGTLAQVSWVIPPGGCCEHPQFPPAYGATFIAQLLDSLTANPEVWSRTSLFIMYDENDGFFDHMPPPMPPSPDGAAGLSSVDAADEVHQNSRPFGLGMRVPMLVVSPWSRGGWVCSQVFDHTSVIRFLESRFGVQEPNISAWRRTVCGDLTSAFDFTKAASAPVVLPPATAAAVPHPDTTSVKIPPRPEPQAMPRQLPGTRPARSLPYTLEAHARLDAAQSRLWIDFANRGPAGAVFHAYPRLPEGAPRIYTVAAGATLSDSWLVAKDGAGLYDLAVYGPNGFLRVWRGDLVAASRAQAAQPEVTASADAHGDVLVLSLRNAGTADCALTLVANAYGTAAPNPFTIAAGATTAMRWNVAASAGWYDLTVSGGDGFLRRFAGHLENGTATTTDPAMGALIAAAPFDAPAH